MTKEKKPLISVIITNYNYAKFIREAIESVLAQTYENIELIVIDDGSTDGSKDIILEYTRVHSKIRFISQENKGVVFTRNLGLDESTGEYFIFIDADDTIPSIFISDMYETIISQNADVVFCDLKLQDKMKGTIEVQAQSLEGFKHFIPTPICQLVRKSAVSTIRFDENLSGLAHEDNDFFFALFLNGAKFVKSSTHYNYRIHGGGRSPDMNTDKHYRARLYIIEKYKNSHNLLNNTLIDTLIDKDNQIDKWHQAADERFRLLQNKDVYIKKMEEQIMIQDERYTELVASLRYRVGKAATLPLYGLKKVVKKLRGI